MLLASFYWFKNGISYTTELKEMMRALIIRPSALGDTLLLAPALHQIADRAELTLLGRRPGVDFLRPFLLNCLDYEKGGWHTLFLEEPNCKDLPLPDVDRVISFLSDPTGKAKRGLRKCLKHLPIFSFPPFPPKEEKIHVALYLASCLKKSGLPVNPEEAIEEAKRGPLLIKNKPSRSGDVIVLHPGSGSKKKNYPPEFWVDLIRGIDMGIFHKRVLLLGPAEEEWYQFFAKELSGVEGEIVISPNKDRLLLLLKEASFYIGHDSGITHLAAMLGTPTIALFKNSHPLQWAPLGPDVEVIANLKPPEVIYKKIKEKSQKV
jgi:ADP-heptose:LPS heptosyltransferase